MIENIGSTRTVSIFLCVLGIAVIGFVSGAFSARFQTFPYPQLLEPPFQALAARQQQADVLGGSVFATGLWHESRSDATGVTRHSPPKSWGGLTLYTSGHHTGAFLVDEQGRPVHRWSAPFREVWPEHPQIEDPVPEDYIYWRRVHLYPNGDILASYSGEGDTPYGYGLAKFDRRSRVLWKFDGHVHHDFAVRENGSIVALTHRFRDCGAEPVSGMPQFRKTVLEDHLVVISPEGELQGGFSLIDALADSKYRELLEMYPTFTSSPRESRWDPLHSNTVDIVGPEFAQHHAFAEPGDVMTSFRNPDTIAIVDLEEQTIDWASRGFWSRQHDPDPRADGNVLLFDNNGNTGSAGDSRLLEFDPRTHAVHWSYRGTRRAPFSSVGRSSQQELPNGNVLVTESAGGRIFEITREGRIVWEYFNPERQRAKTRNFVPIVCSAQRFRRNDLEFVPDAGGATTGASRDTSEVPTTRSDVDDAKEP